MIPLMKNTFLREQETREALSAFILKADRLSMGEQCAAFERKFSEFQESQFAVLVNSGASANLTILQALLNLGKLKQGDRVGFSAVTWSTNVMPILQLGMIPVPVDCSPDTLNSMSGDLKKTLATVDLDAFFITNALGFGGDLHEIQAICAEENILLIEDNCEALGSRLGGTRTGNFGVASSFSFFVAHHMSTIEGGMICTSDEELAEMITIVRANGWDRNLSETQQSRWRSEYDIIDEFHSKYAFFDLGYNVRPTEVTGFIGCQQVEYLAENIAVREENHLIIEEVVRRNPELSVIKHDHMDVLSSFATPVMCASSELRLRYVSLFQAADIEIRPMIGGNIQNQPFYKKYVSDTYDLPGATQIQDQSFYCGNYPELTRDDLEVICECLSPS